MVGILENLLQFLERMLFFSIQNIITVIYFIFLSYQILHFTNDLKSNKCLKEPYNNQYYHYPKYEPFSLFWNIIIFLLYARINLLSITI